MKNVMDEEEMDEMTEEELEDDANLTRFLNFEIDKKELYRLIGDFPE